MATYITTEALARAALRDAFESLYDLPADSAQLDSDILSAEREVDAHLVRYRLPLSDTTAITYVRSSLVGPIFAEYAWQNGAGEEIPKKVADAAKRSRDQLKDLRKGMIDLAGANVAASDSDAGTIAVSGNTPQFDRTNMEAF